MPLQRLTHIHIHYRDLSDEGPNRVTATQATSYKTKNTGAGPRSPFLPPVRSSPDPASSSEASLLDGPGTKLPPLRGGGAASPYESSSTTSLVEVPVKRNAKKSARKGRR